eukprot:scaffold29125_cov177-Skeletonema_menzelii.AAC.1
MVDPDGGNLFIVGSSGHEIFIYTGNEDDLDTTVRENRYSIRAIIILSCVEHIPEGSFESCNRLETIGGYAFSQCTSLRSVVIPSVEVIKCYAFQKCSNLDTVELPDAMREIGERAFVHCIRLTHLIMPLIIGNPNEVLHRSSFLYCDNISRVDFRLFDVLALYLGREFSDDLSRIIGTFQQSTHTNSTSYQGNLAMTQLCTSMYNVYLERISNHLRSMRSAELSVSYIVLSTLGYGNFDEDAARRQLDLDYGIVNVVADRVLSFLHVPDSLSIVAHGVE